MTYLNECKGRKECEQIQQIFQQNHPKCFHNQHHKKAAFLHNTHFGANKMKALARSCICWPRDGRRDRQSRHVMFSVPSEPWSRLHLDFAGPVMGHMFLLIVDAHSKWLDVHLLQSISSANTIETLGTVFATHGLPHKVVTDNGSSFTSEEFRAYMSSNGIIHVTSAPYHPSSKGLVKRAVTSAPYQPSSKGLVKCSVQTFKCGFKDTKGNTPKENSFLTTVLPLTRPQELHLHNFS